MPWVALSSELGYLKMLHGPNFLLYLNLAYIAPSLPTLLLQLAYDQGYNQYFGTAVATLIRQGCAQMVCALCCVALPFLPWKEYAPMFHLIGDVAAVGERPGVTRLHLYVRMQRGDDDAMRQTCARPKPSNSILISPWDSKTTCWPVG